MIQKTLISYDTLADKGVEKMENTARRRNPYLEGNQRNYRAGYAEKIPVRNAGEDRNRREEARRRRAILRRRQIRRRRMAVMFCGICLLMLFALLVFNIFSGIKNARNIDDLNALNAANPAQNFSPDDKVQGIPYSTYVTHPEWTEDFLTENEYSRPGDPLTEVNNIFVHYTANQNTSAAQNRSYFEQLKDSHERSASAHFIIGYNGEIIQCIPLDEIAYAVMTRNMDSISIECCYTSDDGSFTQETYDSLIKLLRWLIDVYELDTDDILRHYDCGGKKCPIYYTDNPDEWEKLKKDVADF